MAQSSFKQYLRSLRWTPLPVGVGLALIAFQQYRHTRKREAAKLGHLDPCDCLADEWEVEAYKLLPLRYFSRAWGWVNGKVLISHAPYPPCSYNFHPVVDSTSINTLLLASQEEIWRDFNSTVELRYTLMVQWNSF